MQPRQVIRPACHFKLLRQKEVRQAEAGQALSKRNASAEDGTSCDQLIRVEGLVEQLTIAEDVIEMVLCQGHHGV